MRLTQWADKVTRKKGDKSKKFSSPGTKCNTGGTKRPCRGEGAKGAARTLGRCATLEGDGRRAILGVMRLLHGGGRNSGQPNNASSQTRKN